MFSAQGAFLLASYTEGWKPSEGSAALLYDKILLPYSDRFTCLPAPSAEGGWQAGVFLFTKQIHEQNTVTVYTFQPELFIATKTQSDV